MGVARAQAYAELVPAAAHQLWMNTGRWPTFIDGFDRVLELDAEWPAVGSKVVWQSNPAGRGRVTERVLRNDERGFETQVFEEQMTGRQSASFDVDGEGTLVTLSLDYELTTGGPLRGLTDVLFIRRSLTMALERTLRRYSTEAEDEARL